MTPVLTRLLLAALASVSILLARKALRHPEWELAASSPEAGLANAPRQWVAARQLVAPSVREQPCAVPTFYQARWLGPPRAVPAVGGR